MQISYNNVFNFVPVNIFPLFFITTPLFSVLDYVGFSTCPFSVSTYVHFNKRLINQLFELENFLINISHFNLNIILIHILYEVDIIVHEI